MASRAGSRFRSSTALLAAACLWLAASADARYARVEVEKVPLDRLAKNLQEAIEKEPKNAQLVMNLARVHAMAYTIKSDEIPTRKGKPEAGPWFGYEPKLVPFGPPKKVDDPAVEKAAKLHLDRAIELYRKAVVLDDKNLTAKLGLGWVLDQAGKDKEAIAIYREVIEAAWMKEKDLKALGLGGHTYTAEAASYLIPLLDKEKDRKEIATLVDRVAKLKELPRPITPIAVPLRDGLRASDLEDRNAAVAFDADGTTLPNRWTWITADAAWLVHEPDGTGKITSGLQLFGNVTFWLFWETGYDALAVLDDNRDGELRGPELHGLALWRDANANGISEPGEVKPLAEYDIVALSCRYEHDASHSDRIAYSRHGVTYRDGRKRPSYDLVLHSRAE